LSLTLAGKQFDVLLLYTIVLSVAIAMLDSIESLHTQFGNTFYTIEWGLTIVFAIEYLLRIYVSPKPLSYIFSFWGLIDVLSILPTLLSFFFFGYHYLFVIRVVRLLRVFRILKLIRFNREATTLTRALRSSSYKIGIFLFAVFTIVILLGTIMYVVEGGKNGFTSIPQSIYWAIITLSTVGYGDIVPHTVLGKFIASIAMIIGYAIIAVPTGIVTVEMSRSASKKTSCSKCLHLNEDGSNFCNNCGEALI